jgi:hypothetical protein
LKLGFMSGFRWRNGLQIENYTLGSGIPDVLTGINKFVFKEGLTEHDFILSLCTILTISAHNFILSMTPGYISLAGQLLACPLTNRVKCQQLHRPSFRQCFNSQSFVIIPEMLPYPCPRNHFETLRSYPN